MANIFDLQEPSNRPCRCGHLLAETLVRPVVVLVDYDNIVNWHILRLGCSVYLQRLEE